MVQTHQFVSCRLWKHQQQAITSTDRKRSPPHPAPNAITRAAIPNSPDAVEGLPGAAEANSREDTNDPTPSPPSAAAAAAPTTFACTPPTSARPARCSSREDASGIAVAISPPLAPPGRRSTAVMPVARAGKRRQRRQLSVGCRLRWGTLNTRTHGVQLIFRAPTTRCVYRLPIGAGVVLVMRRVLALWRTTATRMLASGRQGRC